MNAQKKNTSISSKQLVLWIGAGISYPAPSCLPLGKDLTEFTIETTCGTKVKNNIFSIWERVNELLIKINQHEQFGVIPRLESILDVINELEQHSIDIEYSFMQGFQAFLHAPYNDLHENLACLLKSGATIITSNFDLCIEKAYNEQQKNKDYLVPFEYGSTIVFKSMNNKTKGEIWHYHGTVDNIQKMGATLSAVKMGLSPEFQKMLIQLFKRPKTILFLGYSFSDAFDVNPFFENLPINYFGKRKAIFFQHNTDPHTSPKTQPRIERLLKCFSHYQFIAGDTAKYLSTLTGKINKINGTFDWKTSFYQASNFKDNEIIRPFITCQLANFLGIHLNKLSRTAYKHAKSYQNHYPKNEYYDTMAVVLRRQGKIRLEKKFHQKKELPKTSLKQEKDWLGYYYSRGQYQLAQKYAVSPDEILTSLNKGNAILPWRYYTSMSAYYRPIIYKYLNPFHQSNVTIYDRFMITKNMPVLNQLISRPLHNVYSNNQIATALRLLMVFNALLNRKNNPNIQNRIFYLYGESSSIAGYISSFRDIAIQHFFLYKYHHQKKSQNLAFFFTHQSLAMAKILWDIPGMQRAIELLLLLKLHQVQQWFDFVFKKIKQIYQSWF